MTAQPPARPAARARNRRGEGDRLRRDLLDAAERLLEEVGSHEALSLRAVAREVGIATTSVYLHFADRTQLLIAIYKERFVELSRFLEEAAAGAEGPAEQLRACCLAYGRFAVERPNTYRVMFEVPGTQMEAPAGMSRDELPGVEAFDVFRRCLGAVMDAGLAPRTDLFLATTCLIAALHGVVTLRINRPSFPWPPVEDLVDHLLASQVGLRPGG
ncbi:MAG TPA: TetR/AcrR family transcriptional regulator [Candidatus Dormibacteraeota bacterium]|nr:TetR/AcrR family transcriptional regulator [Candidatus Dormibacteraeota bacterium]